MDDEPNIFQAPIVDEEFESVEMLSGFRPEGFPHPLVLGWIGLFLAFGIIATLFFGYFSLYPAVAILPFRIAWVIFARVQIQRHGETWSPGSRTFVLAVWIINLLVLCLDAMVILLFATCLLSVP